MKAKSLSNLYPQLTPEERYSLILSATLREDDVEAGRLKKATPMIPWDVADYHGHLHGFHNAALMHVIECLNTIAWMLRFDHNTLTQLLEPEPNNEEVAWLTIAEQASALALLHRIEAWRQFCTTKGIDPEAYLRLLPGWMMIADGVAVATKRACTVEQAEAWTKEQTGEGARLKRTENYLDELRQLYQIFVEHWAP